MKIWWFFIFLKNFLKGFLLWTTFFIFSVFKNFFKAFLLWTTLQKKWRFLCFGKSRVSSSRFQKIKFLKSITFHRFSMVLKTVLIGFEPILRRQNDFCHYVEKSICADSFLDISKLIQRFFKRSFFHTFYSKTVKNIDFSPKLKTFKLTQDFSKDRFFHTFYSKTVKNNDFSPKLKRSSSPKIFQKIVFSYF